MKRAGVWCRGGELRPEYASGEVDIRLVVFVLGLVVVVRPESIVLHQKKPSHSENVLEGKIGAAMFLGEYVDCTIELGKNVLETHQPHSLRVRRGDTVWVELPVGDCMALPAEQ